MAASGAGPHRATRVRSAGGAHRLHHPAGTVGARSGLSSVEGLGGQRAGRRRLDVGEPLQRAVQALDARRRHHHHLARDGRGAAAADPRADRKHRDGGSAGGARVAGAAARHRRAGEPRRFRHRALVARLPAAVSARLAQGRPLVRPRHRRRRRHGQHRQRGQVDGAPARAARRGRRHRERRAGGAAARARLRDGAGISLLAAGDGGPGRGVARGRPAAPRAGGRRGAAGVADADCQRAPGGAALAVAPRPARVRTPRRASSSWFCPRAYPRC